MCQHPFSLVFLRANMWARQLSRYSDWLRAGRSGDRIPVGASFSALVQTGPGAHPVSCTMGTGSFPVVKSGRGVTLTPHPLLVPLVMKEQSQISTPPKGRTARTEPQCLYKGALYFFTLARRTIFCNTLCRLLVSWRHVNRCNRMRVNSEPIFRFSSTN